MDPYMLNEDGELEFFENIDFSECDDSEHGVLSRSLFFYALSSIFLFFFGTVISTAIISYYMFNVPTIGLENDESETNDEDDEDEPPYEYKYIEDFEELMKSDSSIWSDQEKAYLSKLIIMDTTPNGDVVMSYEYDKDDDERSKFIYYSNSKTIPYKYLDAVARKFVCAHKCPNIYVFIKDELMKEMKRIEEENKRDEEQKNISTENDNSSNKKQDSVFASFKNYKTSKSRVTNSVIKKRHILVTKNKYKYMGTFDDYNLSLLPKEEKKEVKPISFYAFKQMNHVS
jgi:hypothetical protein